MSIPISSLKIINKEVHKNLYSNQAFHKLKLSNRNNKYYNSSWLTNNQKKTINDKDKENDMQVKYQKPKGSYKGNRVKYKTEMCKLWADNKQCKFGDKCLFAHGEKEIKKEDKKDKSIQIDTQISSDLFKTEYYPDGLKCKLKYSNYSNYFSFANSLKKLSQTPAESIKQDSFVLSKRLNVFHQLTQENNEALSTEECDNNSNNSTNRTTQSLYFDDNLSLILHNASIKSKEEINK